MIAFISVEEGMATSSTWTIYTYPIDKERVIATRILQCDTNLELRVPLTSEVKLRGFPFNLTQPPVNYGRRRGLGVIVFLDASQSSQGDHTNAGHP